MKKRLYVSYGSNLNLGQMKYRCPTAKLYGTGVIEDYELQFKGHPQSAFATIAPKEGASVPVAVWEIKPLDEAYLDRYEGYPSHYFKQDVPVKLDGEEVSAMVYIMNLKMNFGMPSTQYYRTVHEGYKDCGLDTEILKKAVAESAGEYFSSVVQNPQSRFCFEQEGEEDYYEEEEPEDEDLEEDGQTQSEGMQM